MLSETGELIFTIEAKNAKAAEEWIKTHKCKLRGRRLRAAIGGKITYMFTPSSIGELQNVECVCGAMHCINAGDL